MKGYMVTFASCGDVQHFPACNIECGPVKVGAWMSHWWPIREGLKCQSSGKVVKIEPCAGHPECEWCEMSYLSLWGPKGPPTDDPHR